ncbi:MAG TPA: ABC transporter substrate-binding protein, partial [Chloroflexota bacterium]|nr:ABC transporter substrate-binding protein [Chloroflexota bacterium]
MTANPASPSEDPKARPNAPVTRRSFIKLAAMAIGAPAALELLSACSPATPATSPTAPAAAGSGAPQPTAGSGAPQPTAAPAAKAASSFKPPIMVQPVDPETLDPHFGESGIGMNVLDNLMETLVNYDRNMNLVPVLAESWQVMDDKVTWRFKLRQNVKFQNGEPFNAEAVKFTIDRTLNADLRSKGLNDPFPSRSGVTKVNVIDPYTVELVLKEPNIILPVFLTFLYILEPKYYSSKSLQETALRPMGTGPWRVTD